MPEYSMKLSGWHVIIAAGVLIAVAAGRFMTLSDKTDDKNLMKSLETQLVSDYFPDDVERLKAAWESGDKDAVTEVANSVTTTKVKIESVQASYPLLSLSTSKDVVVKVTYSLLDESGPRGRKTNYYLYSHGAVGNTWSYRYETSSARFYLSFR